MGIKFEKKTKVSDPPFEGSQPAQDSEEVVKAVKSKLAAVKKAAKKTTPPSDDAEVESSGSGTGHPPAALSVSGHVVGTATSEQPVATTTIKHPTGVEEQYQEPVGGMILKTEPMANVGLSLSMTKNLGNYNNVKYGVSLHMPSGTSPEALEETFKFVEQWVDAKMAAIGEELLPDEED